MDLTACPKCGHQPSGKRGWITPVTCATAERDDVYGDAHRCSCRHESHGLKLVRDLIII